MFHDHRTLVFLHRWLKPLKKNRTLDYSNFYTVTVLNCSQSSIDKIITAFIFFKQLTFNMQQIPTGIFGRRPRRKLLIVPKCPLCLQPHKQQSTYNQYFIWVHNIQEIITAHVQATDVLRWTTAESVMFLLMSMARDSWLKLKAIFKCDVKLHFLVNTSALLYFELFTTLYFLL